jgi:hypothetical protein
MVNEFDKTASTLHLISGLGIVCADAGRAFCCTWFVCLITAISLSMSKPDKPSR